MSVCVIMCVYVCACECACVNVFLLVIIVIIILSNNVILRFNLALVMVFVRRLFFAGP